MQLIKQQNGDHIMTSRSSNKVKGAVIVLLVCLACFLLCACECEHDNMETTKATKPTCVEEGRTKSKYCPDCDMMILESEPIPAKGHVAGETVDSVEATCSQAGYSGDILCSVCGVVMTPGQAVAMLPHTLSERIGIQEATCTASGYTGDVNCTVCGVTVEQGETVSALSHALSDPKGILEPSCYSDGHTGNSECEICGTVVEGETVAKLGHDYVDDICSRCGWTTPGLYKDGVLVMNWDDLKSYGYIVVENGQLTDMVGDFGNGKLVIGEDVTYLDGNFKYGINRGNVSEVWLPYSITKLGSYIGKNPNIKKIVVYCNVTSLPNDCFKIGYTEDNLETLILPDYITSIGSEAITRTKLVDFKFPSQLEYISGEAFYGSSLTDVILPENVKSVGLRAFASSSLKSITFPAALETLGAMQFLRCSDLEYVDLSACENITELSYGLFRSCTSLKTLKLPPNLKSFDATYSTFGDAAEDKYIPLETLILPEGFNSFGRERFERVNNLKTVVWPASLLDGKVLAKCPIEKIYYTGTESQWNMVNGHDLFPNAEIVFEYDRSQLEY